MTSTSIRVFKLDDVTGKWELFPFESGKHTLGFDSDLKQLWGASILVSLGFMILHSISETEKWPIKIEGDDLDKLEQESQIALANKQIIFENTDYKDVFFIELFLNNIVHAVKRAREWNGGVVIW